MENQTPTASSPIAGPSQQRVGITSSAPSVSNSNSNSNSGVRNTPKTSLPSTVGSFSTFQISGYGTQNRSQNGRPAVPKPHAAPAAQRSLNGSAAAPASTGRKPSLEERQGRMDMDRDGSDWDEQSLTDSVQAMLLGKGLPNPNEESELSMSDDLLGSLEEEELSAGEEVRYYDDEDVDEMSLDEAPEEYEDDDDDFQVGDAEDEGDDEEEGLDEADDDDDDDDDDDEGTGVGSGKVGELFGKTMDTFHRDLIKTPSKIKPKPQKESRTGIDSLGRRYTKRRKAADMPLSHEVQALLGQANQAYVDQDHERARRLVTQVIQIDATVYPAWKVLGEIYRETGDTYKCVLAWTTAAHVRPNDPDLWVTCARMTMDLIESEQYQSEAASLREQAIYLFAQALKQDPQDSLSIYQRASLLRDSKKFRDAARGFESLLSRFMPHDMGVVRDLAQCYVDIGNVNEAIELFEKHIQYWKSNTNPGEEKGGVGWTHVNIYGDILQLAKLWGKGIQEIRTLARWLYGRPDETYWDTLDDDREWDEINERKNQIQGFVKGRHRPSSTYFLPPELRLKLAHFRLKINDPDEAQTHFEILKRIDANTFPDVLLSAGDACAEICKHQDALDFYGHMQDNEEFDNSELWMRLGKSLVAIGDSEEAEKYFKSVAEMDEMDLPSRKALADLYKNQGERELAKNIKDEIRNIQKVQEEKAAEEARERLKADSNKPATGTGFFNTILKTSAPPKQPKQSSSSTSTSKKKAPSKRKEKRAAASAEKKQRVSQRYLEEKEKTEMCLRNHQRLMELMPRFKAEDPIAIEEWMEAAREMVEDFSSSRALYPSERYMTYPGFLGFAPARALRNGEKARDSEGIPDKSQYRGISFDIWLDIILEYAMQLTLQGELDGACKTLRRAQDANIFFHDQTDPDQNKRPAFLLSLALLACTIHSQDTKEAQPAVRWFTSNRQFQNEAYNLYSAVCCLVRGPLDGGDPIFNNNINQKYFMRHIKTIDHHVHGKSSVGTISMLSKDESGEVIRAEANNAALAILYGNMLSSGTSFVPAMNYYTRAYNEIPNNPMVLFTFGLAYLNRAFQAQAENRQYQILQSLQFLFKYYEVRMKEAQGKDMTQMFFDMQEAEFNVARAFHQIGLPHHAIAFYEKVLKISDSLSPTTDDDTLKVRRTADLKWEAAYNLQLIYATSGNLELAKAITDKYLVL